TARCTQSSAATTCPLHKVVLSREGSRMPQTLFTNANLVLDGFAELQPSFNVLVKDGRIVRVSPKAVDVHDAAVIDVDGRTLMPGLIDAHAHITGLSLTPKNISYPAAEIAIASANYLRNCLMDG